MKRRRRHISRMEEVAEVLNYTFFDDILRGDAFEEGSFKGKRENARIRIKAGVFRGIIGLVIAGVLMLAMHEDPEILHNTLEMILITVFFVLPIVLYFIFTVYRYISYKYGHKKWDTWSAHDIFDRWSNRLARRIFRRRHR